VGKKVSELSEAELDYWVAKSFGMRYAHIRIGVCFAHRTCNASAASKFSPSADWSQGGPIIEREGISIYPDCHIDSKDPEPGVWFSQSWQQAQGDTEYSGSTPLTAAMRAYVASKFGEEVPDET
jgi:hypothetical protein